MKGRAASLCLILLVCSVADAAIDVTSEWDVRLLKVPGAGVMRGAGIAVAPNGLVLVPRDGGALIAGLSAWAIAPSEPPIVSLAVDERSVIYATALTPSGVAVQRRSNAAAAPEVIATLPQGTYQLAIAGETPIAFGRATDSTWHVWSIAGEPVRLYDGPIPVTAVAVVNRSTLLVALGTALHLVSATRGDIRPLIDMHAPVDGVAVAADSAIYVSTSAGISVLRGKASQVRVAQGMHGPIASRGAKLYVLDSESGAIFELTPRNHPAPKEIP